MAIDQQQDIERIRKRLMRLMLISILITLFLFGSVVTAIIYKLNHEGHKIIPTVQTINLSKDSQIINQSLNGSVLSILIKNANKQSILIYDYKTSKLITTVNFNQ